MLKKSLSVLLAILMIFCSLSIVPAFAATNKLTIMPDSNNSAAKDYAKDDIFEYDFYLNVSSITAGNTWEGEDSDGCIASVDGYVSYDKSKLELMFNPPADVSTYWPILSLDGVVYNTADDEGLFFNASTNGWDYLFDDNDCVLVRCFFKVLVSSGSTEVKTIITSMYEQNAALDYIVAPGRDPQIFDSSSALIDVPQVDIDMDDSIRILRGKEYSVPCDTDGYPVTWSTSDASVVSVDQSGKITANGNGIATIKAYVNKKSEKECTITVGDDINDATITPSNTTYTYTGAAQEAAFTVKYGVSELTKGTDYNVTYSNNINAGTAKAVFSTLLKPASTKTVNYTINPRNIHTCTVTVANTTYDGTAQRPLVTVKYNNKTFVENTDYTLEYSNNQNAGTGSVKITGINNLTDDRTENFTIGAKDINNCTFSSITDQTYTSNEIKPSFTVKDGNKTLSRGTDYTVSYSNNKNVGTATVTVTGNGNYNNSKDITFNIVQLDISQCTVTVDDVTYNGNSQKPELTVKYLNYNLISNTDFTAVYSNNRNAGTATVTITGKGNFKGTTTAHFTINPKSVDGLTITAQEVVYSSNEQVKSKTPAPSYTVKDSNTTLTSSDYDAEISLANLAQMKGTLTVTGKGNYTGTKSVDFDAILMGDADSDAYITISDATYIQRVCAHLATAKPINERASKLSGTSIEVTDATKIQMYLVKKYRTVLDNPD